MTDQSVHCDDDDEASNYSIFETINHDCLREIFQHLNLFDATNLASSCSRLLYFANSEIFPKQAKEINISMGYRISNETGSIVSTHHMSDIINLQIPFSYFGNYVEHLALSDWSYCYDSSTETDKVLWSLNFEKTLQLCPNLKKLSLFSFDIDYKRMQMVKNVICQEFKNSI